MFGVGCWGDLHPFHGMPCKIAGTLTEMSLLSHCHWVQITVYHGSLVFLKTNFFPSISQLMAIC